MSDLPADYELVIRPSRGWLHLNLGDVWRYRDLLFLLVHRDFVAKYKQTILGPAWFILQPLLTTVVFTVIFGKVAKIPDRRTAARAVLPRRAARLELLRPDLPEHLRHARYQRQPLRQGVFSALDRSAVRSHLQSSGLRPAARHISLLLELLQVLHHCWRHPSASAAQSSCFPLLVLQIAALSLGVGLWLSALTAKYRDFTSFERLYHPDLDVCHARDLSSLADPGELAMARGPQSR